MHIMMSRDEMRYCWADGYRIRSQGGSGIWLLSGRRRRRHLRAAGSGDFSRLTSFCRR